MMNILSIIGLLAVAASAIDDNIIANESSKPTAMKDDNQLIRRRKTKSAKSSDSGDGGDSTTTSDLIPFIDDAPDAEDSSISMSMSMPGGADDPFIGLAESDASMLPDIDSSTEEEEEEESVVAYGDTKDGATTDQWHALVSILDATHESYTPPDADIDESEEEDESDSTPSKADSPWHEFMSTLDATHESYTPPESEEDTAGEDTAASEVEDMSMSSTASSMSMPPGDGREDESDSDGGSGSSKARKLSTAHDTTNIHGRMTKIGLTRMKKKMDEELPWGDDSSMSMSVPIRTSEADIDTVAAADTEEVPMHMPDSKSSKAKTWKAKSAKFGKADDQVLSMPNNSKSGKAKSSKRV
jgi:hypothetical protein